MQEQVGGAALGTDAGRQLRVRLMDGFSVTCSGEPVALPSSAQRLVAFLALQRGCLPRRRVAGRLWLDSTQERANASLRSALWRSRHPDFSLVEATGQDVGLAAGIAVDARELSLTAHTLIAESAPLPVDQVDPAPLAGELLPDWYDDWVLRERDRLRQLYLHALEALCRRLAGLRRYGEAVEAGLMAVHREPLRESAHRTLITVHLAEGNSSEAIRQYESYRAIMRDELGLDPSPQMRDLLVKALRAE